MSTQSQISDIEMASLLEAGCIAMAFQERMHAVITYMKGAPYSATLSSVLSFGRTPKAWMSVQMSDALLDMDVAAAASAATAARRTHPATPAKNMLDAARAVLKMHPEESALLVRRIEKAKTAMSTQKGMTEVSKSIMEILTASRELARLAGDVGERLDADAVIGRYDDPVDTTETSKHQAERVLCRAFGVPRASLTENADNVARVELIRSLTFMSYEMCHRDGLVQAEARQRFEELVEQAQNLAARQKPRMGPTTMLDAMTDSERGVYSQAIDALKAANMNGPYRLSGRVFVVAAAKITQRGQPSDNLKAIRRAPEYGTQAINDFLNRFENSEPGLPVQNLIPIYVDPETPSLSLRDALLRALHANGTGKLSAGDILCFARSESDRDDGPMGMFMNQEAAKLCETLRKSGFVTLAGISNTGERLTFEGACDGVVGSPKELADLARNILLKRKYEDTAMLRLASTRRAAIPS
ncbi:hypothetical protein [Paucibacter soli]|uniref:hypothetical protein n=1 Tax=Paucibacter soli TaxID=3133433 RepID=UPI0030AC06F7